jgi:hypothetical protein
LPHEHNNFLIYSTSPFTGVSARVAYTYRHTYSHCTYFKWLSWCLTNRWSSISYCEPISSVSSASCSLVQRPWTRLGDEVSSRWRPGSLFV